MELKVNVGENMLPLIPFLSKTRLDFFKEYPYLYIGNSEYETSYIESYAKGKDAMFVTIEENGNTYGIASGISFSSEFKIINNATSQLNKLIDINLCAYLGELIIFPQMRGKGYSRKILKIQEDFYRNLGYKHTCFLTVIRTVNHPLKPTNYVDSTLFWEPIQYKKTTITTIFNWPTLQPNGEVIDQENELVFWIKDL
jgi:hypothetical protein